MQVLWCWRCQMDIPMLDEEEWQQVAQSLGEGDHSRKRFRKKHGLPLEAVSPEDHFLPALRAYERITGFAETNPSALFHHRIALYGPPCHACGKPLRTPEAKLCASCGEPRAAVHPE